MTDGSGGRVGHPLIRGFDPRLQSAIELSLGKIGTGKLLLLAAPSLCECVCLMSRMSRETACEQSVNVCVMVNAGLCCKALWYLEDLESATTAVLLCILRKHLSSVEK